MVNSIPVPSSAAWLDELSWSSDAAPPAFPLVDVLGDSVFYLGAGFDGDPVKHLHHHFRSFVYADYGREKDSFEREIRKPGRDGSQGFWGYRILGERSLAPSDLTPAGWSGRPAVVVSERDGDLTQSEELRLASAPFARWVVFERLPSFDAEHGPSRFSLVYIAGEGVATYQALYYQQGIAPAVFCLMLAPIGFGRNWTDIRRPGLVMHRLALLQPPGAPRYLLCDDWGTALGAPPWPEWKIKLADIADARRPLTLWQVE